MSKHETNTPAGVEQTDFASLLPDLHAGVFAKKIDRALSDVALGVISNGKAGEVTIKLKLKQIGDSNQVAMTHEVAFVQPTNRGKRTETDSTDTPLHVGPRGKLSIFPGEQTNLFAERERDRTT